MAEEVKLFGVWRSHYSKRVEIALKLKGIPYEYIEEDLSNKSPLLLKYNPVHKKIPVLVHNGKPIAESFVILEYIDETWKQNPILPDDPYERASARFWAKFIDEKCMLVLKKACWGKEGREKGIEEACECLRTLEGELKGNKFFGGERVGLVDIVADFIGFGLRPLEEVVGIELLTPEKFPVLFKWSEEFVEVPIVKETLPSKDELIAHFTKIRLGKAHK